MTVLFLCCFYASLGSPPSPYPAVLEAHIDSTAVYGMKLYMDRHVYDLLTGNAHE